MMAEIPPGAEIPPCFHCGMPQKEAGPGYMACANGCAEKWRASWEREPRPPVEEVGCGSGWCALCLLFRMRVKFNPNEER